MRSTHLKPTLFFAGAALLSLLTATAQIAAVVKGDRTNVRAKPGFDGEVLTSLKKGDIVAVIGEVDGMSADGKTTRSWSKIELPAKVAVWVYGPLLDAKTKTVKGATVNLRAGPGRIYSELGKLSQGASVTIVRSLEDWTQIEPPTGTFAYVASSLVDTTAQPSVVKSEKAAEKPAEKPTDSIATAKTAPPIPAKTVAETPAETKPPESIPAPVETKVAEAPQLKPAAAEPVATPTPAPASIPAPIVTAPALTPATPIPAPAVPPAEVKPRHVIRDGVVGGAISVQSPGYFELRSLHAEGVVDYLVSEDKDLDLAKFHGKAVTVSGEEWRDVRWKTPVLKVKSIEAAF